MHIRFLGGGTGSARAAADYLVGERDSAGRVRPGVEILRGNPNHVAAVADPLEFPNRDPPRNGHKRRRPTAHPETTGDRLPLSGRRHREADGCSRGRGCAPEAAPRILAASQVKDRPSSVQKRRPLSCQSAPTLEQVGPSGGRIQAFEAKAAIPLQVRIKWGSLREMEALSRVPSELPGGRLALR